MNITEDYVLGYFKYEEGDYDFDISAEDVVDIVNHCTRNLQATIDNMTENHRKEIVEMTKNFREIQKALESEVVRLMKK